MKLEEAYAKNIAVRKAAAAFGEQAPYGWIESPGHWPFEYMAYSEMLKEHATELANSINQLRGLIAKLSAWAEVLKDYEGEDTHHHIVIEFAEPLATVALNLPYVIRSRFIYSVAHLCHQANRSKVNGWKDDFPVDQEVYFDKADEYGQSWKSYSKLKPRIEGISNRKYAEETLDFRNKYNHRYSPRIEHGQTGFVVRSVLNDGRISYAFGSTEPLKVSFISELLKGQHHACIEAYKAYQKLVNEQIKEIVGA